MAARRGLSFGGVKFCGSPGFKPGEAEPGRGERAGGSPPRGAVRQPRSGRREEIKRMKQNKKTI